MGITEVITAPRSPWQNPYVERLIGSIRHECLDHVIILNERHLRRVLLSYFQYHHDARTHLSLSKDCPRPRRVQLPSAGNLIASPRSAVCIIAMSVEPREIGEAARSACPNPFALNSFLSKDTLYRSRPVKLSAISAACGRHERCKSISSTPDANNSLYCFNFLTQRGRVALLACKKVRHSFLEFSQQLRDFISHRGFLRRP
jgi:hypothetical protein